MKNKVTVQWCITSATNRWFVLRHWSYACPRSECVFYWNKLFYFFLYLELLDRDTKMRQMGTNRRRPLVASALSVRVLVTRHVEERGLDRELIPRRHAAIHGHRMNDRNAVRRKRHGQRSSIARSRQRSAPGIDLPTLHSLPFTRSHCISSNGRPLTKLRYDLFKNQTID